MLRRLLAAVAPIVAVAILLPGTGLGAIWRVHGASMEPTITDGSLVVVDPLRPNLAGYRRGDIVILAAPGSPRGYPLDTMIKRLIALPGEHVRVADSRVQVDGRVLDEPYLPPPPSWRDAAAPVIDLVVPPGEVFVLGDHRELSLDSTSFGSVPIEDLHGRVLVILGAGGIATPALSPVPGTVAAGR